MAGMKLSRVRTRRFLPRYVTVLAALLILGAGYAQTALASTSTKLACKPDTLQFGLVEVGQTKTLSTTLVNTTTGSITISKITKSTSQFWAPGLTLPFTIGAGKSRILKINFKPAATGLVNGTLSLYTRTFSTTIYLHGTGVRGWLKANPISLSFGSVPVGTAKSLGASLSASGASVTVTGATSNSTEFGLSGLSFPFTIPAGQRISFSIKFAPKISGTAYGKITFSSNAANSPVAEALTGTGTTTSQHLVSLSWKPSTSAVAHYNVYRSGTSGGPYTKIASVPGTSYTDASVQAGKSYYYVTTAVSSTGKESSHSNQVHALIP